MVVNAAVGGTFGLTTETCWVVEPLSPPSSCTVSVTSYVPVARKSFCGVGPPASSPSLKVHS